jgi:hypothetical protein
MAGLSSLKNATIVLTDTNGANTLTLVAEDGNFSFTLPNPHEHVLDRGAPGSIIDGVFEPITWTMDVQVREYSGSTGILDVVTGVASGWTFTKVTTSSGSYNAKTASLSATAVDVFQMKVTVVEPFGPSTENMYFFDNIATISFAEGMPNKWTLSGTSYMTTAAFMANID